MKRIALAIVMVLALVGSAAAADFYVMVNRTTGHVAGINGPDLSQWPEADWRRFARPDLHNRQGPGTLAERFRVEAGMLVGPLPIVTLKADQDAKALPDDDPASAKRWAVEALTKAYLAFRARKPDGSARYNADMQLLILKIGSRALVAGKPMPTPVAKVELWFDALAVAFVAAQAQVVTASTVAEVKGVLDALGWPKGLEARFGVGGSEHPDPDVTVAQLIAAGG